MSDAQQTTNERLGDRLRSKAPALGVDRVTAVERLTTGLSSQSYRVEAETANGPATWVMRVEPKHGVIPPYDITREYRLLEDVGRSDVPVPEMLHLCEDESVVGGRFLLMSFIRGRIYSCRDAGLAAEPELTAEIQKKFVEMLARVHATKQSVLPSYTTGPEACHGMVAVCRDRMARTQILPSAVLLRALDVLEEKAPEAQSIGLLHGDYRLPNMMWEDREISGILDWELAAVGDPLSDLAFTQTVGAGHCGVEGPLAEHYSQVTGIEIDPKKIGYYKLLEMVKSTIIGLAGGYDMATEGTDLRLLSVATVAVAGQGMFVALEAQLDALLAES